MAAISGVMASHLAMVRTHTYEGREGESEGERERGEGRGGGRERRKRRYSEEERGREGGWEQGGTDKLSVINNDYITIT